MFSVINYANSYTRNVIIFYITTLKILSHIDNNYCKIIIKRIIQRRGYISKTYRRISKITRKI